MVWVSTLIEVGPEFGDRGEHSGRDACERFVHFGDPFLLHTRDLDFGVEFVAVDLTPSSVTYLARQRED